VSTPSHSRSGFRLRIRIKILRDGAFARALSEARFSTASLSLSLSLSLSPSLSASPEFYVAELFVIVRRGSNRARKARLLLPQSEPRESLNDVTFVVSLPRRRAFARLNCTSSVSTQAPPFPRFIPRFFSRPSLARSVLSPSFLKDLYSASRRPDK